MKTCVVCALLLPLAFALPAKADVLTTYDISFTGSSPLPTSGSFTYDSTNPNFSNFTVVWDGISFDLTASANNPASYFGAPACSNGNTGAAAAFALLTTCNSTGTAYWSGELNPGVDSFQFGGPTLHNCQYGLSCESFTAALNASSSPENQSAAVGGFSIEAVVPPTAATPEPKSFILLSSAILLGLIGLRRRSLFPNPQA
jgi:hypothetical protein